jgi:hypothetical protein
MIKNVTCLPVLALVFYPITASISSNKMNCELMLTYDTPTLWQTGSRNLTGQKTLPTLWGTYIKLVTTYQISAINSYWEKCDEKYLGWTEGRTEVKQYTPLPFGERRYKKKMKMKLNIIFTWYHEYALLAGSISIHIILALGSKECTLIGTFSLSK